MSTRAMRRSTGKRAKRRRFEDALKRILELHEKGVSPAAIASSVGVAVGDVLEVLAIAERVRVSA
jgi:hypothetical protein